LNKSENTNRFLFRRILQSYYIHIRLSWNVFTFINWRIQVLMLATRIRH